MSVLCSFFEANVGGIRTITSRKNFKLTISSCVSVRMSRYWARGKFGEQERGVRVARGTASCNSSFLSNIIKAINAAVNLKFYYCRARSKQYASMFTWQFFTVKLMFLSWSWEKVYSKMIVKSIFKCRKTINSPENCYWEKITFQKMICTRHSL